ncbi:protein phosphatase 2C domain-containing protein [Salinibacter grassmerensis]|uniref:protein phosphatase 2C domain-containing protein n=1 Tax=Salinibacter grassmerensis TaxID=3040353 RepID=UPI0021E918CD|nr:protein phosphatase 2C domain-containing protein [Salinibacter grassmerensis]
MSATSRPDSSDGDSLTVEARVWAVSKGDEDMDTYEDAASVRSDAWPVRAAVADGATESAFAGAWAERLTRGVVEQDATTPDALRSAVPEWQAEWRDAVRGRVEGRPWYVEAKAEEGAFATLLGLSLRAGGQWRAVGVGDCCLFRVRGEALVRSWPFDPGETFTNRPALVPSRPSQTLPTPEAASGEWSAGDIFVLATDALAAWLLGVESPVGPATVGAWDEEQFRRAVERGRTENTLRNDDATLLVAHITETPPSDQDAVAPPINHS